MMKTFKSLLAAVAIIAVLSSCALAGTIINDLNKPTAWNTAGSPYTVTGSVTIGDRIYVTGSVTLILTDGCELNADKGIHVGPGNSLTITTPAPPSGTGVLTAKKGDPLDQAAIGGDRGEAGGTITINGGTVRVIYNKEAYDFWGWYGNSAGIGGGDGGAGGTVTISGGTVEVWSYSQGAGIGCGQGGAGGSINITGGSVTVYPDGAGPGIGGSENGPGGTVNISGGTVTTGSRRSPGIGGGNGQGQGTLSSGPNGSGWIVTNSVGPATDNFSGVIFNDSIDGGNGKVYGNASVSGDVEIPSGKTLEISSGKTLPFRQGAKLTIPAGTKLMIDSGATVDATKGKIINDAVGNTNDGILMLAPASAPKNAILALNLTGSGRVWINGKWYSNGGDEFRAIKVTHGSNGKAAAGASEDVRGSKITLTASPDVGYELDSWNVVKPTTPSVTITGKGNASFTMPDADVEINATFKKILHKITVENDGHGTGEPRPTEAASGDTVTLVASPDSGYEFDKWQPGTPPKLDISNDGKFTMPNQAVTVKATFKALPPPLQPITVDNDGGGTGSAEPTSARSGDKVRIIPSPNLKYEFVSWDVISPKVSNITGDTFTMPNAPVTAKVTFKRVIFSITADSDANGAASADKTEARSGDIVTLTASPDVGYEFDEWEVTEPASLTIADDGTFTMPEADVEVKATFKKIIYSITVDDDGNGIGSAIPTDAASDDPVALSYAPDIGYAFAGWEAVDPPSLSITADGRFTMPNEPVTVKATFRAIPPSHHAITVWNDGNGTGSAIPTDAASGDIVTLSYTPDLGYVFAGWDIVTPKGLVVTNDKFTMPDEAVTVKATFRAIPPSHHAITVQNDGSGTGSAAPTAAAVGTPVTLSASPNLGYVFKGWEAVDPPTLSITADGRFTMPNEPVTVRAMFTEIISDDIRYYRKKHSYGACDMGFGLAAVAVLAALALRRRGK